MVFSIISRLLTLLLVSFVPLNDTLSINGLLLLEVAAEEINVQWSYEELLCLFYNCLVYGDDNFNLPLDDPVLEGYLYFRELRIFQDLMTDLTVDNKFHNGFVVWTYTYYVLIYVHFHGDGSIEFSAFSFDFSKKQWRGHIKSVFILKKYLVFYTRSSGQQWRW